MTCICNSACQGGQGIVFGNYDKYYGFGFIPEITESNRMKAALTAFYFGEGMGHGNAVSGGQRGVYILHAGSRHPCGGYGQTHDWHGMSDNSVTERG